MDKFDEFYCLINFSNTMIKSHKNKLQIKMEFNDEKYFVDFPKYFGKEDNELKGMCLLKATKSKTRKGYSAVVKNSMAKVGKLKLNLHTDDKLKIDEDITL